MFQWPIRCGIVALAVVLAGCDGQTTPTAPSITASPAAVAEVSGGTSRATAARPASRCVNVDFEGMARLALMGFTPDGQPILGAVPAPVMIGNISGLMGSVITGGGPSGSKAQGAQHFSLRHEFVSDDGLSSFVTADRAVCAPAGPDPGLCRVNDVLAVVSGTGAFTNANGFLTNHGTIDTRDPFDSTLTIDLGGRVCGDGLIEGATGEVEEEPGVSARFARASAGA